ncbi:MerR family transcriptional regulator [Nonomuraea cavernae]|uniref:MerR family transcriptional regulator n=1 Tax=Nonomuraea cavernae TaxID=2045107 RepID=A0A917ZE05_9ACTN|nr:MerR family transcriptional regulator [Nonomuraea cavernae]MCA2190145.1 MerR family transcriptional regulator [Nonomuraea cavernae]GGO81076.1 MerR family transcriptional regulator [Nonomuraea cavernae]
MSYTIGRLAKLTGLPVKTIRFYSDAGVLPERERTPAGYRIYGDEDRARLELIRTLREIGVDLATIRSLGDRRLRNVLDLHLKTVETQLRSLQRTRAVLRATLARDGDPAEEDLRRLHALGRVGVAEMELLLDDFVDEVGGGVEALHEWLACRRDALLPELPEEPTVEQLDAWLELAELLADADYRARLHRQSREFWEEGREVAAWNEVNAQVTREAMTASRAGVEPGSPESEPILERILALMGLSREELLRSFDEHDPRAARQWELVAIIQGTPWPPEPTIAYDWIEATLRNLPST